MFKFDLEVSDHLFEEILCINNKIQAPKRWINANKFAMYVPIFALRIIRFCLFMCILFQSFVLNRPPIGIA